MFCLPPRPKSLQNRYTIYKTAANTYIICNNLTRLSSFKTKPLETTTTDFEATPTKIVRVILRSNHSQTVATGFEAKPAKTVRVVLMPNHSQTANIGFEAQPRNPRSSSPRARCRSHTASPDLLITRPPSTGPVRPSSIICTRSPTPVMILITAHHVASVTCIPRDKQMRFSKRNKGKRKTKQNYPGFEFKHCQVNDSSQSNQGMNHLVSYVCLAQSCL
jgi:hypothetical protein